MPLNEECGLLEWVVNTHALKNILEKGYQRQGKRIWVSSPQRPGTLDSCGEGGR